MGSLSLHDLDISVLVDMIGENIELLGLIAAESSDSVVHRPVPVLNLVKHHRQNNNIVYGLILQQINLVKNDNNIILGEDKRAAEDIARLAGESSTVYVCHLVDKPLSLAEELGKKKKIRRPPLVSLLKTLLCNIFL